MPQRDRGIRQSLSVSLTNDIHKSRVLLVGAGGIGCEVLKNLVCCGFGSAPRPELAQHGADNANPASHVPGITIVDLDTIDLSNLNRQFLFRKHHIKKPKAFVAKETASQFNPSVNIDAHHASIFDSQYHVDFYKRFDIVFNALDNLAARRHVNRMCLAANVPLIESGTTGYNGQVQAIKKALTECYDCNPKPVQTSYPICTIRSTPTQPIHCIVWAKSYLLPELFGDSGEEQGSDMKVTNDDNAEEVAKLQEEAEALKRIRDKIGQPDFAKAVFDKVFGEDIERLRSMTDMWKTRKPPNPLQFSSFAEHLEETIEKGRDLSKQDQTTWSLEDSAAVFFASLDTLSSRVLPDKTVIEFDKDDKDTLDFVTASANLRAHIFEISATSEWKVKQMAGNIIPAIATSNAMTASLCVLQAFKILRANAIAHRDSETASNGVKPVPAKKSTATPLGGCKMTFLTSKNADRMITSETLRPPNPHCAVCSPIYAQIGLPKDGSPLLSDLVNLLKTKLTYEDFSISTDTGIIYDPEEDDNLNTSLGHFGITATSTGFLTITDDADEPKIDLVLSISRETHDQLALLPADIRLPLKPAKAVPELTDGHAELKDDTSTIEAGAGSKRKREDEDGEEAASKKAKAADAADAADTDEAIVIEDDGTILLEDD